ncbi:hypothetical protein ACGFX4_31475 [Kitasatospora sp. NPDC048365]|uniref:hypothetical protein n=1 Tax=Kitasatospora sp. NPDC048365 TaxID=3364050 RepID=UPI0037149612
MSNGDNGVRSWSADQDRRTVMRLRLGVGVIGLLLPVALPLGNWIFVQLGHPTDIMPASMSGSYYTSTRNLFVGSLCALGVFLIGYRYNRRDDVWTSIAGWFAIGVALFPTMPRAATAFQEVVGVLHLVFAGVLLCALAVFCLVSFRDPVPSKANRFYLAAGVLIPVFLAVATVSGLTGWGSHWPVTPLYLCEALSVWAFGAAWVVAALRLGAFSRTRELLGEVGAPLSFG